MEVKLWATIRRKEKFNNKYMNKKSAVADKPRDAFVQMQWRGLSIKRPSGPYVLITMPNLVIMR